LRGKQTPPLNFRYGREKIQQLELLHYYNRKSENMRKSSTLKSQNIGLNINKVKETSASTYSKQNPETDARSRGMKGESMTHLKKGVCGLQNTMGFFNTGYVDSYINATYPPSAIIPSPFYHITEDQNQRVLNFLQRNRLSRSRMI
jgi:hypothetical protein